MWGRGRLSAAVSQSGSLPGREYGRGTKKHLEYQGMVFHPLGITEGNPKSIIPKELLLRGLLLGIRPCGFGLPSWEGGPIPATSSGRLLRRRSNIPAVKTGGGGRTAAEIPRRVRISRRSASRIPPELNYMSYYRVYPAIY